MPKAMQPAAVKGRSTTELSIVNLELRFPFSVLQRSAGPKGRRNILLAYAAINGRSSTRLFDLDLNTYTSMKFLGLWKNGSLEPRSPARDRPFRACGGLKAAIQTKDPFNAAINGRFSTGTPALTANLSRLPCGIV